MKTYVRRTLMILLPLLIIGAHFLPAQQVHADEPTENISEIGDYVWLDVNGDGIQNDGQGIEGVHLYLFRWNDDHTQYTYVGEAITDQNGHYVFKELPMGYYQIQIIARLGDLSPLHQGDNTGLDSDFDPAGYSPIFLLGARNVRYDYDAGLIRRPPPPLQWCHLKTTCLLPMISSTGT